MKGVESDVDQSRSSLGSEYEDEDICLIASLLSFTLFKLVISSDFVISTCFK